MQEEDELSLLDLMVVVAENLKLLILGPVIAGTLALGASYVWPQRYVSEVIVALPTQVAGARASLICVFSPTPAQAATLMVAPQVLGAAAVTLAGTRGVDAGLLSSQVKAAVGKDGLLRLEASAATPEQAQAIANAVLGSWLQSTAAGPQERIVLENRLANLNSSLASLNRYLASLSAASSSGSDGAKPARAAEEVSASLVAVLDSQARYLGDIATLTRQIQGLDRDEVVKQAPTLPAAPAYPRKTLVVAISALVTGLVLLLWVFMRQAWRNAKNDPHAAPKIARVRAALGLREQAADRAQ